MTTTLEERTLLPPEGPHREELGQLADLLRGSVRPDPHSSHSASTSAQDSATSAKLVGPDGREVALPEQLYQLLTQVVDNLGKGLAVVIEPSNAVLTTQEAADLLHISRPTFVKLLERGAIPYHKTGRHRRVYLADVLEYDEHTRREREGNLDEMAYESAHDDTIDDSTGFIPTR
ncbi:helix-turn-helix domain-containing protein [Saccharomonospora iraqiensis]|uniref:helix-turn-helix domain-containing protein n=1 Tax=Saccharomonospora iraqiensis TaxID=52698 RepID=UPI00022DED62|nr:helix-turn-helix domain-containing protein [Saccharomonospora iraqiensis]